MFRKVLTASIIGFMMTSTLVATTASAATISNGVVCPKANKTIMVSGAVYKCTKSPILNKKKLTWVSKDCIDTNAAYLKSNASYLALVKVMPATLAALDAKIAAAKVDADAATLKADGLDAQIKTWQGKIVEFTTARDAMVADKANAAKNAKSIAAYTAAIRSLNSAIRSNTAASAGYRRVGRTVTTMQGVRATTVAELTQTKTGVAQSLSMRNLICAKGL
jgi:peptidoglycan hydrolase CwlO-like protein